MSREEPESRSMSAPAANNNGLTLFFFYLSSYSCIWITFGGKGDVASYLSNKIN